MSSVLRRKVEVEIRAYVGALSFAATLLALAIAAGAVAAPAKAATFPAAADAGPSSQLVAPESFPGLFVGAGYRPGGSPLVRDVQRLLVRTGYRPGPIDGRYGPLTEAAVTRFQVDRGLQADGIAGRQTLAALHARGLVLLPGAGSEPGGSRLVRGLQRHLARMGYRPGPIDGRYGPLTEAAVKRFQAARGLHVDGIAAGRSFGDPRAQVRLSRTTPAPASAPHGGSRTAFGASPSARPLRLGLIVLFGLAGLALLIAGVAFARQSRRGRPPGSTEVRRKRDAPAVAEQAPRGTAAQPRTVVEALPATNGSSLPEGTAAQRSDNRATEPSTNGATERPDNGATKWPDNGAPQRPDNGATQRPDNGATQRPDNGATEAMEADSAFNLGVLLEEQGDLAAAEAAYRRADELGHASAASNLGVLLEGRGDLSQAEATYRRADQRGEANGAFNLGVLLEEQHHVEAAEAAYRRADERGHAAAASNLGVLLEARGDRIGAEAAYRRADQRGEARGAFNLGVLLEEQGDLAEAEPAYRRANQAGQAKVAQLARAALLDLGSRAQFATVASDGSRDGP